VNGALPQARSDRLIVRQVDGETLLYDLDSHEAHCLNETCAAVWERCDGSSSPTEIARALGYDEEVVWLALEQLWRRELLVGDSAPERERAVSRRRLLKTALVALPLAATVAAPSAATAASCLGLNEFCFIGTCCPGLSCCQVFEDQICQSGCG